MNYIGNMLAKKDCENKGGYEPIFYNSKQIITECAIRNMFYFKDNTLLTPSLDLGILSGVMRDTILNIAKDLNFDISETHIDYNIINNMDEAFISSTGIGLLPCYWDGWNSDYANTNLIKKELFKRIKNS
jgi:branched-subunit amino acid aminotransferase/4-amino-4-deoxychorismate lyase